MICHQCSKNIPEGSRICPFCAAPVVIYNHVPQMHPAMQGNVPVNPAPARGLDGSAQFLAGLGVFILFTSLMNFMLTILSSRFGSVFLAASSSAATITNIAMMLVLFAEGILVVCGRGSIPASRLALGVGGGLMILCALVGLFLARPMVTVMTYSEELISYAGSMVSATAILMIPGAIISLLLGYLLPGRSLTVKLVAMWICAVFAWILCLVGYGMRTPFLMLSGRGLMIGFGALVPCWARQSRRVSTPISAGWFILGFFIPIVGLVLFLMWNQTRRIQAKSVGLGALISTIMLITDTLLTIFSFGIIL